MELKISPEHRSANEHIEEIQSYFRYRYFSELIVGTIQEHISDRVIIIIK